MRSESRPARAQRLCWLLAASLAVTAAAHADPVPENTMKAAFVFNFTVFAEWPAEALAGGAPISLCANAGGALFASLSRLHDKVVNGHRIAVRHAGAPLRTCHVLVLERIDRERWRELRRELAGAPVLTVSDDGVIGPDGVVIAMEVMDDRIVFDIDMAPARAARLALSSKLLRLARSVQ
ncbi:YfiR family protein [Massilia sp. P8910]|uniref:YfiR family protein n=1 Tax=Massilia antarctica TaxID=2765360 RepID=UPI0006BB7539|nr:MULTISPECIES: YfiR family protein [Massilia]MCE3602259.1 YfiR family protein [Massilia antarctica]MCY0912359.1 YfiR family protein [Massilia sp. H27-R4]CUI03470.1 putative transmembrane protein [Janthinobacterium sp. CG23_2]CUU27256.1 putative transmembrane protein [Janthinobacterium sp. CG23_2]